MSSSRFKDVAQDKVELREIFTNTEDGFVYQVEIPDEEGRKVFIENIDCNEIPDDYLPELG